MTTYFLDVEADGFLETATTIHCICAKTRGEDHIQTFTTPGEIENHLDYFPPDSELVWHNGFGYDIPLLELFGVRGRCDLDTLAVAREWWPDNPRGHGLDAYATYLGGTKPKVTDWKNQPLEVYVERCSEDTRTTELVYEFLLKHMGVEA